ncbi:MAG TPA: VTT domain-containing protein, partial [Myxococcaceae bacterium]|nr:VTT domain-containing protein [Myxococcaceae bacterium]
MLLRYALREHLDLRAAVAFLQRLDELWWSIPAYLAVYVVLTAAFAPAVLLHAAAGVTWGFKVGVALNILACNGAASLQFLAARKLGRERVRWILERKGAAGMDRLLSRAGFETALLIRLMPLPTMAVNVAGGLSSIRWGHFALGTLLGTLPIIIIYTWFASELAQGVAGTQGRILRNLVIAG